MRQQIFCEDRHKDFAADRHEAGGGLNCLGSLVQGVSNLRGANRQRPGQFEAKD